MGSSVPKQFMQLQGRAVIEYPIDTFDRHEAIDEVSVVVHPDWRGEMEAIMARNTWKKLTRVIDGGAERYLSTLNAVMAYIDYPDDTNLLLHDAARPFVSEEIVSRVAESLKNNVAVGVAIPSTDTVWEIHPDFSDESSITSSNFTVPHLIARIPERKLMWRAQTPQAFRLPLIRDAYQRALQDPQFRATDDCGVVRTYMPGTKIAVVEGAEYNVKLTYDRDVCQIETLINLEKR